MTQNNEEVIKAYEESGSIRAAAKKLHCTWYKIAKALSSEGFVVTEAQAEILRLHREGRTAEEIAGMTGYSIKTVKAYLPRVRPIYGENLSENAKRIKKFRERKLCYESKQQY